MVNGGLSSESQRGTANGEMARIAELDRELWGRMVNRELVVNRGVKQ